MTFKNASLAMVLVVLTVLHPTWAQTNLNTDNTIKAFGSFDGSSVDIINLQNGNLILWLSLPVVYGQRGGKIAPSYFLSVTGKTWSVQTNPNTNQNFWTPSPGCAGNTTRPCGQGPVIKQCQLHDEKYPLPDGLKCHPEKEILNPENDCLSVNWRISLAEKCLR